MAEDTGFYPYDLDHVINQIPRDRWEQLLRKMFLIRHFEVRAESAYQQGFIGGFFHAYIGQEAIQSAAVDVIGTDNWWTTSYRCHALALLLGAPPQDLMAELYGRADGNAKGRGGSMHFYTERLLGGFGIVGGQVPIATGAAFQVEYLGKKNEVSVCFLGDGAVAQGAFHESLNLASLWSLPCIYVIENNKWGMGTHVSKAISAKRLAEDLAAAYGMKGYALDGMDFFSCWNGFKMIHDQMLKDRRPVLVEVITERFRGHSISDPGLYRSKDEVKCLMEKDPIKSLQKTLLDKGIIDEALIEKLDKEEKARVLQAMKYAESSPWPDPSTLEQDVFAD